VARSLLSIGHALCYACHELADFHRRRVCAGIKHARCSAEIVPRKSESPILIFAWHGSCSILTSAWHATCYVAQLRALSQSRETVEAGTQNAPPAAPPAPRVARFLLRAWRPRPAGTVPPAEAPHFPKLESSLAKGLHAIKAKNPLASDFQRSWHTLCESTSCALVVPLWSLHIVLDRSAPNPHAWHCMLCVERR
jgi:hypothetical protein